MNWNVKCRWQQRKDKNGVFRGCNKLLAKLSGFNEVSDLVGKTDYEVTTKEEADKISDQSVKEKLDQY